MAARNINPLECSICLENFQNPRLISCHHSFCFNCLDDFIKNTSKNNKFNCPVCRKEVEVPPGGVAEFSVNFYINTLKDENLMTKSPKLMAEGLPGNVQEDDKHFCEKHPKKEVEFFCVDCQVVACSKCSVSTHKTHELLDLDEEETRQKFVLELSQIKSKLEDRDEQNNQLIKTANMDVIKLSEQADREIQKISDHVYKICLSICHHGGDIVKEIRNHVSLSKKKLEKTTSSIELCPASLKEDIVNTLKNGASVVNLINTTQKAKGLVSTLNKTVVKPTFKNVEFVMSNGSVAQKMVGHIKMLNRFVTEKLNLNIFGPDQQFESVTSEKQHTFKNFCWSLTILKYFSTIKFYLIRNDTLDNMPGAHSIPNDTVVPNYTIKLLNLKDRSHSISRSLNNRHQMGWNFLNWDEFTDSTNGFIDENQDFYVEVTFLKS